MKKKVFGVFLGSSFLMLILASGTYAQLPGAPIRATIPFDFTVADTVLPAGEYKIRRIISDRRTTLEIHNIHATHAFTLFHTIPVRADETPTRAELVFHRYGNRYFLSQVWTPALEVGQQLPPSQQERVVGREMVSNHSRSRPRTVTVAVY
jgi:hypothetical protein